MLPSFPVWAAGAVRTVCAASAAIDMPVTTRRCVMNDQQRELLFLVLRIVFELLKERM